MHDPLHASEATSHFNEKRILVMDDESAIRELTSQLLETMGYEVTAVPDGAEAIRIYERALRKGENFLAVILDATVRGGLGGVETIERLRNIDPDVNAIICSGYSDEAALSQFLSYGFRGALPKPFTRRELADALQKAAQEHSANLDGSLGGLTFRNLLQLLDKSGRPTGSIAERADQFPVTVQEHNRRETLDAEFLRERRVLLPDFAAERFRARKIRRHQDEVLLRVVRKFRFRENLRIQSLAPTAPIGTSEVDQKQLVASLRFFLRPMEIRQPIRLRPG